MVSAFDSPAVGPLAGELSDLWGELAAATANALGVRFVNTFPSVAFPHKLQPTWKHKCIDYIAIPQAWLQGATQLAHEIDLGNQHDDHQAVLLTGLAPAQGQRPPPPYQEARTATSCPRTLLGLQCPPPCRIPH